VLTDTSASKIISGLAEAQLDSEDEEDRYVKSHGTALLRKALDDAKIKYEGDGAMTSIYMEDFYAHVWPRNLLNSFRVVVQEYNQETGEDDELYDQVVDVNDAVRIIKKYDRISRRRAVDTLTQYRQEILGEDEHLGQRDGDVWPPELVQLEDRLKDAGIPHERRRNGLFVFVGSGVYRVSVGWKRGLIINHYNWNEQSERIPTFANTPKKAVDVFKKLNQLEIDRLDQLKGEIIGEARDRDWSWIVPIQVAGFTVISNCESEATLALDPERTFGGLFVVEKFWDGFKIDYAGMDPIFYDFKAVHCDSVGELVDKLKETQKELIRRRNLERADSLEILKSEIEPQA
jgi:hypothetical protein